MIGILSAAAVARHADVVRTASEDMDENLADELGRAVSEFLWSLGDKESWVWFRQVYVMGYMRRVFRDFQWTLPAIKPKPVDVRRSELSRLAFRLLRGGTTAKSLVAHMRSANSQYPQQMSQTELDSLTVWCAKKWQEESRDAG